MNTTPFYAKKLGSLISSHSWSGKVISVHAEAINIIYPGELLVSLLKNHADMTALGIEVPSLFKEKECLPVLEASVEMHRERLTISTGVSVLVIDLSNAPVWEGALKEKDLRCFTRDKLFLLIDALLREGKPGGFLGLISGDFDSPFVRKAWQLLSHIQEEKYRNKRPILRGISTLIGLGVGYTPSGDDFLTGVMLGERIISLKGKDLSPSLSVFPLIPLDEISNGLGRTNPAGRSILFPAIRGHFPQYLLDLLKDTARAEDLGDIRRAIRKAVAHGETSGTDSVSGLCWYMEKVLLKNI